MNDQPASPDLLQGSCHCGAVQLTLPSAPEKATRCNCSICRRLGGLWAYYTVGTVVMTGHPEHTEGYVWGDKTLSTVRCRHCGCVTHWEPLTCEVDTKRDIKQDTQQGINLNMFAPALLATVQVRQFDGADTWSFLD